jgi:hypothetical protein
MRVMAILLTLKPNSSGDRPSHYVRDDRPFAGPTPPAAVYYASGDRRGEHPQKHLAGFAGILQCDCYSGFEPLFDPQRKEQPITLAFCFAHARRAYPARRPRRRCRNDGHTIRRVEIGTK